MKRCDSVIKNLIFLNPDAYIGYDCSKASCGDSGREDIPDRFWELGQNLRIKFHSETHAETYCDDQCCLAVYLLRCYYLHTC